jgi:hypothetical protein
VNTVPLGTGGYTDVARPEPWNTILYTSGALATRTAPGRHRRRDRGARNGDREYSENHRKP